MRDPSGHEVDHDSYFQPPDEPDEMEVLCEELKEKAADIRRLKEQLEMQDCVAESLNSYIGNLRSLIAELADALEGDCGEVEWGALTQRAREATE
jgi:hypothetical protein